MEHLHRLQAGTDTELEIHDGIIGSGTLQCPRQVFEIFTNLHLVSTPLERASQRTRESRIVLYNQQGVAAIHRGPFGKEPPEAG
ncbi:hypothetical protein BG36_07035 [Aquamicrobium defluvii]|uniref:Uncharacterized protein n=1 Tax=Aquamicrobium defluvii TaxID=69279 RepID=A0A011UHX1_9HYPH|nr:hypothetical protein BG36_07035 [Aquamicrobium defluvii]EZQ14283.1 hypothetical protein CF98_20605 [Halopseudomonas bauzanensis]TDR35196.1 hypothetical protein DES43_1102 [Aquamicrobium defluvii]